MELTTENINAGLGVVTSLVVVGVTYGIMKTKIDHMGKRLDGKKNRIEKLEEQLEEHRDRFVTHVHFDSALQSMRADIKDIQRDIKDILKAVSHVSQNRDSSN